MSPLARNWKAWPVIFLLILAINTPMAMAINEVVDDYDDDTRVSVTDDVLRNSTLECMELNWTTASGWWDDNWNGCQRHYIGQDDAKGVNYTISIRVYKGNGVSSGPNMYCNGSVRDDFGDIRFVDPNTMNELGYWIKEDDFTSGNNALFFVRLDSLNISISDQAVDVYYNNSGATTTSDIHEAVLFGDDFSYSGPIDSTYWTNFTYDADGNFESASSVDGDKLYGDLQDEDGNDGADGFRYESVQAIDGLVGWVLYAEGNWAGADWSRGGGLANAVMVNDTDGHFSGYIHRHRGDFGAYTGLYDDHDFTWETDVGDTASGNWYHLMEHNETDGTFDDWELSTTLLENNDNEATAGINNPLTVIIFNYLSSWAGGGSTTIDIYTDYVYLIKYSDAGQRDGNWTVRDSSDGYEADGYFITTNFLAGLSYNATVLLTNTTIPSGSINAQISNDGTAWSNLGALANGRGALDLRDLGFINSTLMFNYTRGALTETPRLFQVRLVHEGPGNVTTTTTDVDEAPYIAIGLILAMAMVLIAGRLRK